MDRLNEDLDLLANSTIDTLKQKLSVIPGSSIIVRYIQSSYQHDPARSVFELLLLLFAIRYFLASKYSYSKKNYVRLNDDEIDELVAEWEPEPIVKPLSEQEKFDLDTMPVLEKTNGSIVTVGGKELLNFTTTDIFNINNEPEIKQQAIDCIRGYGVGSCGPAGFYGNQDAHADCEKAIREFLNVDACILYAQGFSTVSSVIPCFLKRSDVIVADNQVNLGIQKGMLLSRASLFWYEHGDMADLERTLARANRSHRRGPIPRRFIITEGVYENTGTSPDLKKIIELKKKYKYRLLLDESFSLGVIGATGRGLAEEVGVDRAEIDITLGCLNNAFGSAGGYCAGSTAMVEHQRITSLSYTFSATMPPYLARTTTKVSEFFSDEAYRNKHQKAVRDKSVAMSKILSSNKNLKLASRNDAAMLVLRLARANEKAEHILQNIVDECQSHGILITRHRRLQYHELFPVDHQIKVYVNNDFTLDQVKKSAQIIADAFNQYV